MKTVYLHYDQAALDTEYDNRKKVPNHREWLSRYAAESARARTDFEARLDVPFGTHAGERLDIFPARAAGAPVHVFIHGGYWQWLDKSDFSFVARGLQPEGAAVVVVNYALIPTVGMDELVRQCRASIAWLHRHAASFGGDPNRIYVSGHSAGGHLVAMAMSTDWQAFGGLPTDVIKAGCAISGLYDLEPIRLCYLNDVLALTPDAARRNSPVLLPPPAAGSLLLAVGGDEGPEYHRQTNDLAAAWRGGGCALEVLDMAGHDHFSIAGELESPVSLLARAIQRQMGLA